MQYQEHWHQELQCKFDYKQRVAMVNNVHWKDIKVKTKGLKSITHFCNWQKIDLKQWSIIFLAMLQLADASFLNLVCSKLFSAKK